MAIEFLLFILLLVAILIILVLIFTLLNIPIDTLIKIRREMEELGKAASDSIST